MFFCVINIRFVAKGAIVALPLVWTGARPCIFSKWMNLPLGVGAIFSSNKPGIPMMFVVVFGEIWSVIGTVFPSRVTFATIWPLNFTFVPFTAFVDSLDGVSCGGGTNFFVSPSAKMFNSFPESIRYLIVAPPCASG